MLLMIKQKKWKGHNQRSTYLLLSSITQFIRVPNISGAGYLAYRDVNGSFMIQELCRVIDKFHDSLDILHIATLLNRSVAYERSVTHPETSRRTTKSKCPKRNSH